MAIKCGIRVYGETTAYGEVVIAVLVDGQERYQQRLTADNARQLAHAIATAAEVVAANAESTADGG